MWVIYLTILCVVIGAACGITRYRRSRTIVMEGIAISMSKLLYSLIKKMSECERIDDLLLCQGDIDEFMLQADVYSNGNIYVEFAGTLLDSYLREHLRILVRERAITDVETLLARIPDDPDVTNIPEKYCVTGYRYQRLVNESDSYHDLERKFAMEFSDQVSMNSAYIEQIIFGNDYRHHYLTNREKKIAASMIQWLGTPVGQGMLVKCGQIRAD